MKVACIDFRPHGPEHIVTEGSSFKVELPDGQFFWLRERQVGISGVHLFISSDFGRITVSPQAGNAIYVDFKAR